MINFADITNFADMRGRISLLLFLISLGGVAQGGLIHDVSTDVASPAAGIATILGCGSFDETSKPIEVGQLRRFDECGASAPSDGNAVHPIAWMVGRLIRDVPLVCRLTVPNQARPSPEPDGLLDPPRQGQFIRQK